METVENMPGTGEDSAVEGNSNATPTTSATGEITKYRVRLVRMYAWIKDEMLQSMAKKVAGHLFQDKLLSAGENELIHHCDYRRDTIDQLLKLVLMGTMDTHTCFVGAMRKIGDAHIAEELENCRVTEADIQAFIALEQLSLGKCTRPDYLEPRLVFHENDQGKLVYNLNRRYTIDAINDEYLSRLLFAIREHTNVVHCPLEDEKRVKKLLDYIMLCAESTFHDFCDICSKLKIYHVIGDLDKSELTGRKQFSGASERRMVQGIEDDASLTAPKLPVEERRIVQWIEEDDSLTTPKFPVEDI